MTHGSLFSGIGGFELAAMMMGIDTLWNCEIEAYQRKILKKHFPNAIQYEDIKELHNPGYVDIISGGFPCQDISISGKGVGIKGNQSGRWAEFARIIRETRPNYVVIENSPMLLSRGFEFVLCDLCEAGYYAEWKCISNAEFGFPHQRERLYVIAYSNQKRLQNRVNGKKQFYSIFKPRPSDSHSAYSRAKGVYSISDDSVYRAYDRVPNWIHRMQSLGNAVNPIVAAYLFSCIKTFDDERNYK